MNKLSYWSAFYAIKFVNKLLFFWAKNKLTVLKEILLKVVRQYDRYLFDLEFIAL